jgi:hypothetical protein
MVVGKAFVVGSRAHIDIVFEGYASITHHRQVAHAIALLVQPTRAQERIILDSKGQLALSPVSDKVLQGVTPSKYQKQGHPTLIGGLANPQGRISGEVYYSKQRNTITIQNDHGRFGQRDDLTPEHLENVVRRFHQAGVSVQSQWIGPPESLRSPTVRPPGT